MPPRQSAAKVAIVTGASSGIGRATVARLAEQGFQVFGTSRKRTAAATVAGGSLLELDIKDDASVRAAIDHVQGQAGRIDVLVNNAGHALSGAVEETSDTEFRDIFETNAFGTARMMRAVLPIMRAQQSGRIVNLGSILGLLPAPLFAFYSASKHAIEGLSESLDHEVRPFGIRIVLIEPNYTRTDLTHNSKVAAMALPAYATMRRLAVKAFADNTANGDAPQLVADAIVRAATTPKPRLRYAVGQARTLALLRRLAPAAFLDRGIRRNFGIDGVKPGTAG
jgi:NAD(P)-dependent dehydrogenase (short-subunit alcohol dehydrogenase family)